MMAYCPGIEEGLLSYFLDVVKVFCLGVEEGLLCECRGSSSVFVGLLFGCWGVSGHWVQGESAV